MSHHRWALLTIGAAIVFDFVAGVLFAVAEHISVWLGLYWAEVTAVTVGYGDVVPHTRAGHIIVAITLPTVIPLWTASFSLFTSGLISVHVTKAARDIKGHVTATLTDGPASE